MGTYYYCSMFVGDAGFELLREHADTMYSDLVFDMSKYFTGDGVYQAENVCCVSSEPHY